MAPSGTKGNGRKPYLGCAVEAAIYIVVAFAAIELVEYQATKKGKAKTRHHIPKLQAAIQAYASAYNEAPTGTHAQIIATLHGNNPRLIVFLEDQPTLFNPQGELLDHWGTPYHIDLTDPANPRIHSSGPDKQDNGGAPESDDITSWR